MGSNISNEAEADTPEVIQTIPDWNGNAMSIISVPVKIEAKISFGGWFMNINGSTVTNIDSILNAIIADNTAGAGYRLVSIFIPYWPGKYGNDIHWPQPIEWDYGDNWCIPKYIKAMCIFQKDPFLSLGKLHMYFSTVQMKLTQSDPQIYNQLVGAGQYNYY